MPAEIRTFTGVPSLGARQLSRVAVIGVGPRGRTSDAFRIHVHAIEPLNPGNQAGIIMPHRVDQVLAVTGSTSPVAVEWLPVDDLAGWRPVDQDFAELGIGGRYCRRAMPHNLVTGRKLGGNWPGSPESISRCAVSEQKTPDLGRAGTLRRWAGRPARASRHPEVQERYGIEAVSARIDDLYERVVAGSGRARTMDGHAYG
jgi:hypothetical protein